MQIHGRAGEVCFFALLRDGPDAVAVAVRFGGLGRLAVIGFLLPRDRRDVPRRADGARP